MRITVLAGGVGGARFVRGLREELRRRHPEGTAPASAGASTAPAHSAPSTPRSGDANTTISAPRVDVVVNTGDDIWMAGVRLMPDFDSLLYALAGVNDTERGWGRAGESERVSSELREWGVGWPWFTLGDLDLGTHLARTSWLHDGLTISEVGERLQRRWPLGVRLHPATDTEVDTWVEVGVEVAPDLDPDPARREMHFQEWWTRYRASLRALAFRQRNLDTARPAPAVLEAIAGADVVLVAPSNPVVSIGTILSIPGMREALAAARAPIVGLSPIIGGKVVRGMADACLPAIGVETDAAAVGLHYGARAAGGLLDGWLVDETDAASLPALRAAGLRAEAAPLWMHDLDSSAAVAGAALDLALDLALDVAAG